MRRGRVARWLAMVLLGAAPAGAQEAPDAQVWVQALALGQLSEAWRSHVEVQPRVMNDGSELGLTIVRTAVGRQVSPRLTAWLGHAWVPRTLGDATRHEQRLWQQITVVGPVAAQWASSARVRIEQRWLDSWHGVSHRVRLLARAQRPLDARGVWSVIAYDEAMFTLNRARQGPPRGFDRNRLSGGIGRRLTTAVSTELAYIWETATVAGAARRNDHVVISVLNLALPQRR